MPKEKRDVQIDILSEFEEERNRKQKKMGNWLKDRKKLRPKTYEPTLRKTAEG